MLGVPGYLTCPTTAISTPCIMDSRARTLSNPSVPPSLKAPSRANTSSGLKCRVRSSAKTHPAARPPQHQPMADKHGISRKGLTLPHRWSRSPALSVVPQAPEEQT
jgi:hypothetical protein